jgi:2'-5' RNA ligase
MTPTGSLRKSFLTAVVLIPPAEVWAPIQQIRLRYDRKVHRWMPHITLMYPFVAEGEWEAYLPALAEAAASRRALTVQLEQFRYFLHRSGRATLWLKPEPTEPVKKLQEVLQAVVPWCDDQSRHQHGFCPHLSVGQAASPAEAERLVAELRQSWKALEFWIDHVAILARGPDEPFRVVHRLGLRNTTCGSG